MYPKVIFYLLSIVPLLLQGQFDPHTNSFKTVKNSEPMIPGLVRTGDLTGLSCNDNAFYAIDGNGVIYKFAFNANTASAVNANYPFAEVSLAICNNLNGGTYSPTFYTDLAPWGSYFNGSAWQGVTIGGGSNYGGYGNHLYMQEFSNGFKIKHYNGTQLTTVYHNTLMNFSLADLAVDTQGNVIFLKVTNNQFVSDTLMVVSPAGQVVKKLPLALSLLHGYGSFYMNGVYYIGFGSQNPTFPNQLLPVTIGTSSVTLGVPINMPNADLYDLAACSNGSVNVLNLNDHEMNLDVWLWNERLNFVFENEDARLIQLFDLNGTLIHQLQNHEIRTSFDVLELPAGLYLVKVQEPVSSRLVVKKFVKD